MRLNHSFETMVSMVPIRTQTCVSRHEPSSQMINNLYLQLQDLMEKVAEMETTTVPKSVVNGICQVLRSHPDGISLSILRGELRRKNIINDDLCGFRKFSNLIYSRPDIFTPVPPPDGKKEIYVVLTRKRSAKLVHEPVEPPCVEESAESAERAELEQVLSFTGQQNLVFLLFCTNQSVLVCFVFYVTFYFVWIYTYKPICKSFLFICLKFSFLITSLS